MTTATATIYRAHTEGFDITTTSLDEIRTWANRLNARYNLSGKELKIWQGINRNGCNVFESCEPARVITFA